MRESIKAILGFFVIIGFGVAFVIIALTYEALKPKFLMIACAAFFIGIIALVMLLKMHFRKDLLPDFLSGIEKNFFEKNGFCFALKPKVENGFCILYIYFQNRYDRESLAYIVMQPSIGFFLNKRKIDSVHVRIKCNAAAFGLQKVPLPIPQKYQGKVQSFDIGANVSYPGGRGKMQRFRDGLRVGKAKINRMADQMLTVAGMFGGAVVTSSPASFTFSMPGGVAETLPDDMHIDETETIWQLGDDIPQDVKALLKDTCFAACEESA